MKTAAAQRPGRRGRPRRLDVNALNSTRVAFALPARLLADLWQTARAEHTTVSAFIRSVLRARLATGIEDGSATCDTRGRAGHERGTKASLPGAALPGSQRDKAGKPAGAGAP